MKYKIKTPFSIKKSQKIGSVCTNLICEYKTKLGNVKRLNVLQVCADWTEVAVHTLIVAQGQLHRRT